MRFRFPATFLLATPLVALALLEPAPAALAQNPTPTAGQPPASAKKNLTMAEAVLARDLLPKNLAQLAWVPGTDQLAYVRGEGEKQELVTGRPGGPTEQLFVNKGVLKQALADAGAPDGGAFSFANVRWLAANTLAVNTGAALYHFDGKTGKARAVTTWAAEAENVDIDRSATRVACTRAQNLLVSAPGLGTNVAVTTETNPAIVNGQAAHRSEFGITKGTFWSESGQKLAFYRMDQTMVTDYPLLDIQSLPAHEQLIKYPMAGGASHHVTVGVFDLSTRKTVFLQTGEPAEQYLTAVTWAPDEKSVYVALLNRDQNHARLNQYDAATGAFVKTLFEEKDAKYVEPQDPLYFVPRHPEQFVWLSRRDGYRHAYLYSTAGKLLRQLTKGNWEITDWQGFADDGRRAFYSGTADSPLERHTYALNLTAAADPAKLTQGTGTHTTLLSTDGRWLLDNFSSSVTPRTIRVVETATAQSRRLLLQAPDPTAAYALGATKLLPLKAADGQTDLYCRLITPPDFDPQKKYPVVIYVYGGPHVQLVTESWLAGGNLWMQLMAQKGYVVFTMDARGSGNRGAAFEQATFRQMGTAELADQLEGVRYLKSLPYVDGARIGVHGWSYGGFMTTTMLTRAPEHTFKAGVAGGPVIDWKFYEVMYTERYMDTPQQNPEGYKTASLLSYVPRLQDKLLLIHGTVDDVVVWQQSLAYVKKCVDEGIQLDYFVYPGHPHNVRGRDRIHLMQKVTDYFADHL